jgi:hypothetical protein
VFCFSHADVEEAAMAEPEGAPDPVPAIPEVVAGRQLGLLDALRPRLIEVAGWEPTTPESFEERRQLIAGTRSWEWLRDFYRDHLDDFELLQLAFTPPAEWVDHLPPQTRPFGIDLQRNRRPLFDDPGNDEDPIEAVDPLIGADLRAPLAVALGCSLLCGACVQRAVDAVATVRDRVVAPLRIADWAQLRAWHLNVLAHVLRRIQQGDRGPWLARILVAPFLRPGQSNREAREAVRELADFRILRQIGERRGFEFVNLPRNPPPDALAQLRVLLRLTSIR